jgi:hypothetical protein
MENIAVSLCSNALLMLGAGTITSFDEGTDKANVCAALYPDMVATLIASYPWRFSLRKIRLARETAVPVNEWQYQFTVPPDSLCIRACFTSGTPGAVPIREYEIFENVICANAAELWAQYQFRPDESRFPVYFRQALQVSLAAVFAKPITEETEIAELWNGVAASLTATARRIDAQQQPPQKITQFPLVAARFSGLSG